MVRVRGSRTRIIGFTLTGGSNVIQIQEGGSAIIESNEISNANSTSGILVTQNGYARVGGTSASRGNNIHDNSRGITVRLGSGADIFFNTIDNNDRGININANGSVDMSDNVISNSDRGLNLLTGGTVNVSSSPATTGGANTFTNNNVAIRCRLGGSGSGGSVPVGQIDGGGNGLPLINTSGCHLSSTSVFFAP